MLTLIIQICFSLDASLNFLVVAFLNRTDEFLVECCLIFAGDLLLFLEVFFLLQLFWLLFLMVLHLRKNYYTFAISMQIIFRQAEARKKIQRQRGGKRMDMSSVAIVSSLCIGVYCVYKSFLTMPGPTFLLNDLLNSRVVPIFRSKSAQKIAEILIPIILQMQKPLKPSKRLTLQSPGQSGLPSTQQSQYFPSKSPIVSPKFNRKTDFRWSEKKQYPIFSPEHHFVFISPTKSNHSKNSDIASQGILSPPSPHVKANCAVSEDLAEIPKNQGDKQTSHECQKPDDCTAKMQEKVKEIDSLKASIKKLQKTVHKRNKELQARANQFQLIKSYLMERETFISQLQDSNMKLNQSIIRYEKNSERLLELHQSLKDQYDREISEWERKAKAQADQINKLNRINKSLTFQLSERSKAKKSLRKKSKENNENMNKPQLKANPSTKKKQSAKSKSSKSFQSFDLNSQKVKDQSQSSIQVTIPDLFFNPISETDILPQQHASHKHLETQLHKITTLQQKIRYSQIQIDVLKKIKLDSFKIKDDNQKLKFQNRKLLHRIDYLTRNCKRGSNSDSSLELSLSPSKN